MSMPRTNRRARTASRSPNTGPASVPPSRSCCNSVIQVRGRQVQFEGKAIVRRCTQKGLSYIIGLELESNQGSARMRA